MNERGYDAIRINSSIPAQLLILNNLQRCRRTSSFVSAIGYRTFSAGRLHALYSSNMFNTPMPKLKKGTLGPCSST